MIGLHKRLKITSIDFHKSSFLGRNESQDQFPGTRDQILGPKFASTKMEFKMQIST